MLFLLPNILYENGWHDLPLSLEEVVGGLDLLIAESEKEARKYLRHFRKTLPIDVFNKHSTKEDRDFFLDELGNGKTCGLIADAGLPCVADPGSSLVFACHRKGISVRALAGPSSITFSLMLSGFSANRFSFYGYLPKKKEELRSFLNGLEKRSEKENSAEIFIETPYRAHLLFSFLLEHLQKNTYLFVGKNLGAKQQYAFSKSIASWKKNKDPWKKEPVTFILYRKGFS